MSNLGRGRYNFGSEKYYPEATTYADLPNVSGYAGHVYLVLTGSWSGVWYYRPGLYHSDGTTWTRLANLTVVSDEIFTLVDDSTNTKKAMFECSTISAATTRTFTFPDQSGTLALTSDITGGVLAGSFTSLTISGHSAFGADSAISTNEVIDLDETFTDVNATRYGGLWQVGLAPSGALGLITTVIGLDVQGEWLGAVDGSNFAYIQGVKGEAVNLSSTHNVRELTGVYGKATNYQDTDVTEAVGGLFTVSNDDAIGEEDGDITNAYCLLARGYTDKTTGTIATRYGLYVEDVTGGGNLTNQYAIYCPALSAAATDNLFIKNISADSDFGSGSITTTGWGRFDGRIGIGIAANAAYGVNVAMDGEVRAVNYANSAVGDGEYAYGIHNSIVASGDVSLAHGAYNLLTASGTGAGLYGVDNDLTVSGANALGYGVLNYGVASGNNALACGLSNTFLTSSDSNTQTLYGMRSTFRTYEASDIGYGHHYTVTSTSAGGDQYGLYADANVAATLDNFFGVYITGAALTANTAKWGIYVADLDNYFGGDVTSTGAGRFDGGIGVDVAADSSYGVNIAMDGTTRGINYVNSAVGDSGIGFGVFNTITASGSSAAGYGIQNTITASGASAIGQGAHNTIVASGSGAYGTGIYNDVATANDANTQTVYGAYSYVTTFSGASDVGYGFHYKTNNFTTGGNQYGFYADADVAATLDNFYGLYVKGNTLTVNTAKWGVYVVDLNSYFGGNVDCDGLNVNEIYLDQTNKDIRLYRDAANRLRLADDFRIDGDVAIGTSVSAYNTLTLQDISTLTNSYHVAFGATQYANPAGASSGVFYGFLGGAKVLADNAQNFTGSIRGLFGLAGHHGTGTVDEADGVTGQVYNADTKTGTIDIARAVKATTDAEDGTIDEGANFWGVAPLVDNGTYNTFYHLYLENPTVAGTNWAIYSLGGQSAHVGDLRLGSTTAPTVKLDVTGQMKITSTTDPQLKLIHTVTDDEFDTYVDADGDVHFETTGHDYLFGNAADTTENTVHILDGGADNKPGVLTLYADDGTAYYLWIDTSGNFRGHTAHPADGDDDTDGVVIADLTP